MRPESIETAAALFVEARAGDKHMQGLPMECVPETTGEGYLIQAAVAEQLSLKQVGWKLAATNVSGQRHIGVNAPIIGRLYADVVYDAPATILVRNNKMRVAEAEFTFKVGRDVPPVVNRTREQVIDFIDALFPAIELPDSRFVDFIAAGGASLAADNACAREFVLGEQVMGRWREIALDKYAVSVKVNGKPICSGTGADVLGDPREALTWMFNECGRLGITLERDHIITTGVIGVPVPIVPGDHIHADFGILGSVDVNLADLIEKVDGNE